MKARGDIPVGVETSVERDGSGWHVVTASSIKLRPDVNHNVYWGKDLFSYCQGNLSVAQETEHECLVASWRRAAKTYTESEEVVGFADVTNAIEILYRWEQHKKGRMASAYAVYFVERNFSERNMGAVNTLLLNASVERLTEWSMIALLRASYSARDVLPAWPLFLRSVRHCLRDNDKADRLLMGLDG